MSRYRVRVPLVGFVDYYVDADNMADAKEAVKEGFGENYDGPEYNEDSDSANWEVEGAE